MTTKNKNPKNVLPFKFNLENLFSMDRGSYCPEHLFLAYFGDLPSAFILDRFNKAGVEKWLEVRHSASIAKVIKREVIFKGGRCGDDGIVCILKNQIIIQMKLGQTTIFYCQASEVIAKKMVEELLPLAWNTDSAIPVGFLLDNTD